MKRNILIALVACCGLLLTAQTTKVASIQVSIPGGTASNIPAGDLSLIKIGSGLTLSGGVLTATAPVASTSFGGYASINLTMLDVSKPVFSYLQQNPGVALRNLIVLRNGIVQEPGYDYTLDQAAGTVTFAATAQINIMSDRVRFLGVQ